jgi:3-oxoacyl-[acyl-carrier protein] reductase
LKPALLITGAAGVIGQALLRRLAQEPLWQGARWVLTARNAAKLESSLGSLRALGIDVEAHQLDMADEAGCEAFLGALPGLGPFLGLALLAGINHDDPITRLEESAWDQVWQVNVGFHSRLLRRLLSGAVLSPDFRGFLTGSQVGLRGNAGQVAYAAAKGALIDLMNSLPPALRMNVLLPPLVPSPLLDKLSPEALQTLFAMRLMQDPEPALSCAEGAAFLLGDGSRYVQHQVWHADSRVSVLGWPT